MTLSDEERRALTWVRGYIGYVRKGLNGSADDTTSAETATIAIDKVLAPVSATHGGGGMAGHNRDDEDPATPSWLLHAVRVFVITCPTPGFFTDVARTWLRDEGQPDPYVAGPHTEADAKLLRSVPRDVPEAQVTRFVDLILRRYYYLVQPGHEKNADATVREIVRELGVTIVP